MTDPTDFLDRLSGKRAAMDDLHGAVLEYDAARTAADASFAAYTAWSSAKWNPDTRTFDLDPQQSSGRWSGDDGALLGDDLADAEIAADAALDVAEAAADRLNELCGGRDVDPNDRRCR